MVLTKTPLKKHRTSAIINLKDDGTILNDQRKSSLVKKSKSPDAKMSNKQKETKMKSSKILKSASVTKKTGELSKIPVPLSKSSTYKQVTVQKHKMKTMQKKKVVDSQPSKPEHISNSVPSNKADVKFVMVPKDKNSPHYEKYSQSDVASRVKQMKKHDADNLKRIKNQYFSSVLADIRKTDLETTLRKYADKDKNVPTPDLKKKKRKSIKKKLVPKSIRISPRIVSENNENNEYGSINSLRKDTPSLTTHFLDADSQTSQIPVTKKHYKLVKQKKSPRAKLNSDGKDAKSTQLTQHKKKSKTHTLKLNRVQSSDSVPNLPIREIKHNDSFVLSAKKLENSSSMKRAARHKKSPEQLKLKTKRPKSAHQATFKTAEPKNDSTKPEQLKSCLKKTWDENDFTAVNTKYEMNFGLVPLIVN